MSYSISYQGPFIKKVYASYYNGGRASDNPAVGTAFADTVPTPLRRIYLIIQNTTTGNAILRWGDVSEVPFIIYPGQSITFENFNAGFSVVDGNGDYAEVTVHEAFA